MWYYINPKNKQVNCFSIFQDEPKGEGYSFSCQHGKRECEGNKMIGCANKYIKQEEIFVKFVDCVMAADDPLASGEKVNNTLGIIDPYDGHII